MVDLVGIGEIADAGPATSAGVKNETPVLRAGVPQTAGEHPANDLHAQLALTY